MNHEDKVLKITIKPGWKSGTKVTFNQEGDKVPGKIPADVAFIIRDKSHPIFTRDGTNLKYTYKIPLREALCGSTIQIPTLDGKKVGLNCSGEVIKPTTVKRLQGYGLPFPKEPHRKGDLLVSFEVLFPDQLTDKSKPVIGFNTDPTRSEGHLCLPKHYSYNIREAVDMLLAGKFRWFFRRRLRITLTGDPAKIHQTPVELKEQQLQYPEYRYMDLMNDHDHPFKERMDSAEEVCFPLPILALNEIYIGESLSSRVSYLEVKVDKEPMFKSRNSGLCISTGTGSTSWVFNINKLTHHNVETLIKIIFETTRFPLNWKDSKFVEAVTSKFNNLLVFDPESPVMSYTLRDPISVGTYPSPGELRPRGKARNIVVKSKCFDACLVIDGSLSFKFNDGTKAVIEVLDEDSLRTVQLFQDL